MVHRKDFSVQATPLHELLHSPVSDVFSAIWEEVKFVRRSGRYGYGAHDYRRVGSLVVEVDTIEPVGNKSLVPGI